MTVRERETVKEWRVYLRRKGEVPPDELFFDYPVVLLRGPDGTVVGWPATVPT